MSSEVGQHRLTFVICQVKPVLAHSQGKNTAVLVMPCDWTNMATLICVCIVLDTIGDYYYYE
jgi:hypothetical protein